jgi:WD40 repeat protein
VRLWSSEDGKKVKELTGPDDVFSVAFHPDGKSLVSGDFKGVVRQWDASSGKVIRQFDASTLHRRDRIQDVGGVRSLVFDRDGSTLIAAGSVPTSGGFVQGTPALLLFDVASGKLKQSLTIGAVTDGFVTDVHLHADGFLMGVTSGQPGNGKLFFQRPEDAQPFFLSPKMINSHSLAMHSDGIRLAVATTNGNSGGNGRPIKNGAYPGNFSPIVLWDLPTAK